MSRMNILMDVSSMVEPHLSTSQTKLPPNLDVIFRPGCELSEYQFPRQVPATTMDTSSMVTVVINLELEISLGVNELEAPNVWKDTPVFTSGSSTCMANVYMWIYHTCIKRQL